MVPWSERPTLTFDMDVLRHATQAPFPAEAIAAAKGLFHEIQAHIPPKARLLAYLLALRTGNRFGAEFKHAARWIDADPRDVALANLSYDLVVGVLGCSTVVLPTTEGPVIARNMDWQPERAMAKASYLLRHEHRGQWLFTHANTLGASGVVTGLSAKGFAIILNAAIAPDPLCKTGYPVLLHVRRVLEDATDFDDALARLSQQRLTVGALFTLVGTRNEQRVVIERTPKRHALRWGVPGEALLTTNDYRLLDDGANANDPWLLGQTSCGRYDRLQALTAQRSTNVPSDHELLYWLTDHQVQQTITAQHIIIRPAQGTIRLFVPHDLLGP